MPAGAKVPFLQGPRAHADVGLGASALRRGSYWLAAMAASASSRLFVLYVLLAGYCCGAALMAEIVDYQSWQDLGPYLSPAEFAQWHTVAGARALPVLVLPMIVTTLVAVSLLRCWPAQVPRWGLWVLLGCHALAWTSTLCYQLPLEQQLDQGAYSAALLAELWRTDWLRKLAFLVEMPVVGYLALRFFGAAPAVRHPPASPPLS
ncbi:hypothetical protein [Hymenobacter volaticus]|uniref:DUF1772 domain-containing protein n=1 Tax=Hymenobacter volaticus TaxID=2932254 RepID=A0ABY4GDY9_9BACT|nr:hypothetical protein [Hymenobacter volaticus]UOQ69133.1 hypothetical protein MUN86_25800 [Hymenobacter volaticus]